MSNRPKLNRRSQVPGYTQKAESGGGIPVWGIVAAVAVVVVIAGAIAFGASGGDEETAGNGQSSAELVAKAYDNKPTSEFRAVTVTGEPLPELTDPANDPAVGMAAPKVEGANFVNDPVAIGKGPAMIVFGAHWCPHCQREVPQLAQWIDDGLLPAGVDTTLVSTATQEGTGEDPPSLWVATTGWDDPVLVDSDKKDAATAYGLGGFPYFVFLDADGKVTQRASGELPREQVEQYLSEIAPPAK